MGEAAGSAAAMALASRTTPRQLDIAALQSALTHNGAWLGADVA